MLQGHAPAIGALLADVRALLAQPTSTDNFLEVFGGPELALVASLNNQAESSLHAGQRISVYEVVGRIGADGMGEFLKQEHLRHQHSVSRDCSFRTDRFLR